jgi:hypothetical protein
MTVLSVLEAAGRHRSPATLPGYHAGRSPQLGDALPRRLADGGRDRGGHAPHNPTTGTAGGRLRGRVARWGS